MDLVQQKVLNNLLVLALYCPEFYNNCQVKNILPSLVLLCGEYV